MSKEKLKREKQNRTSHLTLHTSQNAITLIALIITIIVMLILVGVSVTVALNGGLFSTANQATTQTKDALESEQMLASGRIKIGDTWYDSAEDYAEGVPSANQGGWKQEGDKIKYVDGAGKVVTTISIGDYVNYDEGTTGKHTPGPGAGTVFIVNGGGTEPQLTKWQLSAENLTWRVLGVNNKGEIELISAEPTDQILILTNSGGYLNAEDNLNNFCNDLYGKGKYATSARSLNIDDINKLANYDPNTSSGYGVEWIYRYPTQEEMDEFTGEENSTRYMQYSKDGGITWNNITNSDYQTFRLPGDTAIYENNPGSKTLTNTEYYYNIASNITAEDGFENPSEISEMLCNRFLLARIAVH